MSIGLVQAQRRAWFRTLDDDIGAPLRSVRLIDQVCLVLDASALIHGQIRARFANRRTEGAREVGVSVAESAGWSNLQRRGWRRLVGGSGGSCLDNIGWLRDDPQAIRILTGE